MSWLGAPGSQRVLAPVQLQGSRTGHCGAECRALGLSPHAGPRPRADPARSRSWGARLWPCIATGMLPGHPLLRARTHSHPCARPGGRGRSVRVPVSTRGGKHGLRVTPAGTSCRGARRTTCGCAHTLGPGVSRAALQATSQPRAFLRGRVAACRGGLWRAGRDPCLRARVPDAQHRCGLCCL